MVGQSTLTAQAPPQTQPMWLPSSARSVDQVLYAAYPTLKKYSPQTPTAPQIAFLLTNQLEAFYGGAAGGGKSTALLLAALMYVGVPGYAALILRRTYADLSLPDAIMDRAASWLRGTDAKWNDQKKKWTFPSGATLTFGYMEHEADKYRYQGAAVQFCGFDELTQFSETQYTYLISRVRRRAGVSVPLRMRGAANPGGIGHDWVRQRFVMDGYEHNRPFIPARLDDNPHLDRESYRAGLQHLDAVTRAQLEQGNWDVLPQGDMFKRESFQLVDAAPARAVRVRYWDKAGTQGAGDFTCGLLMAATGDGQYVIEHVICGQWSSGARNTIMRQTAEQDGVGVTQWVEQEPGSGGKESAESTIKLLAGYAVQAERVTGDKITRARPLAAQVEGHNVSLKRGDWNKSFLDEVCAFPNGVHDDQLDAASGAFNKLAILRPAVAAVGTPFTPAAGYRQTG